MTYFYLGLLLHSLITCFLSAQIASSKGFRSSNWIIIGFLFGIFGLIAAAGLPDKKLRTYIRRIAEKQEAVQKMDLIENDTVRYKKKYTFNTDTDADEVDVYIKLSNLLTDLDETRRSFYSLNIDSYSFDETISGEKNFIVYNSGMEPLIKLSSIEKENKRIWELFF